MLHVESRGSGADVVVIHGTPASPDAFHEVEIPGARVHVVSSPGYGRSPHEPPLDDADVVTRAIAETIRALGVRPRVLVGCSSGAYRALTMCLDGLVTPGALGLVGGYAALAPAHRDALRQLADGAESGAIDRATIADALATSQLGASFRREHPERSAQVVEQVLAACPLALVARDLRACATSRDRTADLRPLPFPVEILVGTEDTAVPIPYSEAMGAGLGVTPRIEPGVGHSVHVERPELWRSWIQHLIARASPEA